MYSIYISAFEHSFAFELKESEGAWFELDAAHAEAGGFMMALNADREVYAVVTEPGGQAHYGTVGDIENDVLADNFGISSGEKYIFYEKPETKDYYV